LGFLAKTDLAQDFKTSSNVKQRVNLTNVTHYAQ